jgi:hypothetical protein
VPGKFGYVGRDNWLFFDKQFIREGWPKNKYDIPNKIYEYWNCKYEPTESKGFVLKGEKIVIPTSLMSLVRPAPGLIVYRKIISL